MTEIELLGIHDLRLLKDKNHGILWIIIKSEGL